MVKVKSKEEWLTRAIEKHGERYDYSKVEFVNTSTEIEIICSKHGSFWQSAGGHMRGASCQLCAKELRSAKTSARNSASIKPQYEFFEKAKEIHGDFYDYSKTVYKGLKYKITITCPLHGDFQQLATAHVGNKQGCPSCFKYKRNFIPDFEQKARAIHGDYYSYHKVDFTNKQDGKVVIVCPKHGDRWVSPSDHIGNNNPAGCSICGKERLSEKNKARNKDGALGTGEFIRRSRKQHGDLYDYSKSIYTRLYDKIVITCKQHGDFEQVACYHMSGNGCQKCAAMGKSRMAIAWLDSLKIPEEQREVRLKLGDQLIVADGFDPATNTIYEFWGDYWHGNLNKYSKDDINTRCGKTFGELYELTQAKVALISQNGYNLVEMWEYDWLATKEIKHENRIQTG